MVINNKSLLSSRLLLFRVYTNLKNGEVKA